MIQKLPGNNWDSNRPPYNRPQDPKVLVPSNSGDQSDVRTKTSLRTKRRNFTAACTAFTLGAIFIVCSSPFGKEILVPGPLSSQHAPLVAGEGADRCAACHANANGSLTNWIASTFLSAKKAGVSQSDLCMKCHEKSLAANFALNPHNVDPAQLEEMTRNSESAFDAGMLFHGPTNSDNEVACSTCHREHHGAKDLTQLTDAQCQTCHSGSFHSFGSGHPEFAKWPQKRRSMIAFDHSTHSALHFPGKQREFSCNQCHVDDAFQNVKKLASFEQSCADCHNQQILESGSSGLTLVELPMIDTQAIEAFKLNVGSWPSAATGDFDGVIPPMMRVMLAADPEAKVLFEKLGSEFEFSDVDPADSEQVAHAVDMIWAIKRLLYDLSLEGPRAVRQRLESVLGFEISDERMRRIITNLDEPIFQNAVRSWLPDLSVEVATHRFGRPVDVDVAGSSLPSETAEGMSELPRTSIALRSSTSKTTFMIKPGGDGESLSANPLAGLFESKDLNAEPPGMPVVHVPEDATVPETDAAEPPSKWELNVHSDSGAGELLSENKLKQWMATKDGSKQTEPSLPKVNVAASPVVGLKTPDSESTLKSPKSTAFKATTVPTAATGWFRNDRKFRISYRPSGHADNVVKNWIDLVARSSDSDVRDETKLLFKKTISMTGIGLCRTCHTVDQKFDRTFQVNWVAEYRDPAMRPFTRFAHGPHMIQPELQDCSHCHQVDHESSNKDSFLGVDEHHVVSNFMPITKSDCASCHQEGRTNNSCTQCHNYHVGSKVIGSK